MIFLACWTLLLLQLLAHATLTAASSYQDIRSLDAWGRAPQLEHAKQAIAPWAAVLHENCWYVAATVPPQCLLASTTLLISGYPADVRWLWKELRHYACAHWEKYDTAPSSDDGVLLDWLVERLQACWEADGRPLGVQVVLLLQQDRGVCVLEPSGAHRVESHVAASSEAVQASLLDAATSGDDTKKEDLLQRLRRIMEEELGSRSDWNLYRVSSDGSIDRIDSDSTS